MRWATPNAEIMLHQINGEEASRAAFSQTPAHGMIRFMPESSDVRIQRHRQDRWQDRLTSMMASWTGQCVGTIARQINEDLFLTAEEAKA